MTRRVLRNGALAEVDRVAIFLSKSDIRQIIMALKARQDAQQEAWRVTNEERFLACMRGLQDLRLDLQRQAKTRVL